MAAAAPSSSSFFLVVAALLLAALGSAAVAAGFAPPSSSATANSCGGGGGGAAFARTVRQQPLYRCRGGLPRSNIGRATRTYTPSNVAAAKAKRSDDDDGAATATTTAPIVENNEKKKETTWDRMTGPKLFKTVTNWKGVHSVPLVPLRVMSGLLMVHHGSEGGLGPANFGTPEFQGFVDYVAKPYFGFLPGSPEIWTAVHDYAGTYIRVCARRCILRIESSALRTEAMLTY